MLTTKKLHTKSIIHELLWFLRGETNVAYLREHGVSIWDEWADEQGELGPVYGHQWRSWPGSDGEPIDQIWEVVEQIRSNPDSRRMIVSAWNVADVPANGVAAVPFVVSVLRGGRLIGCRANSISAGADVFLGVPFNIASYALLTCMVAQVTDLQPGDFVHTLGNAHLVQQSLGANAVTADSRAAFAAETLDKSRGAFNFRLSLSKIFDCSTISRTRIFPLRSLCRSVQCSMCH